jgi:putative two-component system response regulator
MSDPTAEAYVPRILIVDDEPPNVRLLERLMQKAGTYHVQGVTDPREVLDLLIAARPDLIMLDLHMPHLSGFQVLEQLEPFLLREDCLPVVVLTADITQEAKRRALACGAMDFLTKPFDAEEVVLRAKNLLHMRFLHKLVKEHNVRLEEKVRERTRALEEAQQEILERLALAAEFRDDDTGQHTKRVGEMSAYIARALGMPEAQVQMLRLAAPLHDLGKIGVKDAILGKPGKLTDEEFEAMKAHCKIGASILSGGCSPLLRMAEEIALTHHERWAGGGYPGRLSGESIPLCGRIVAVADVFDALTHARPYKRAWSVAEAVREIRSQRGVQFDPAVVDALMEVLRAAGLLPEEHMAA